MANGRKVTRVRIEYDDGSAQEVQGAEWCAEWIKVCDAHAGLWAFARVAGSWRPEVGRVPAAGA